MIIATTDRLTIRTYRRSDIPSLARNINNPKIHAALGHLPNPYTEENARFFVDKAIREARKEIPFFFRAAVVIDKEVVGGLKFNRLDVHKAEIGYWLAEKYWGQGIATEAVGLFTEYGFNELGLVRIYTCVYPSNKASLKVLEKNGYREEGYLLKEDLVDGEYKDICLWAKVR